MKSVLLSCFFILLTCVSCQNDDIDICDETESTFATGIEGDKTAKVGEEINLIINVKAKNGCVKESGFKNLESSGNTKILEPQVTYNTCGSCSGNLSTVKIGYAFKSGTAEDYVLKFKSGENEFIAVTISFTEN